MRYVLIFAFLVIGTVVGVMAYRELSLGPPVVLPTPTKLTISSAGTAPAAGSWTNNSAIDLRIAGPQAASGADIEVRPVDQPFNNAPTSTTTAPQVAATCTTCVAARNAVARVHLADGQYHWQARLHNGQGVSLWSTFPGVIRIDSQAPSIAQLASPTDPNPKQTYHDSTMTFHWQGNDTASGINGYAYRLDTDPHGAPKMEVRTGSPSITLTGLNTGQYYFHVRAMDRAGNWGQPQTFPVKVDVTPPGLTRVAFSAYQFDPLFDTLRVSFSITRPAKEVRVGIYRQSDHWPIRLFRLPNVQQGKAMSVAWNGTGVLGHPVAAGSYEIYIRAIDPYGHSSVQGWKDFTINYQRIVVSLSKQKLWAYDGNSMFLTSLVTTGNRALPTPTGTFHVLGKFHPFTFRSPWPKSSVYWYPPSPTQWAMLFREGGYFIHDAPWRTAYGPGTNQGVGKPGSNYTGTHGCINVPPDVARRLFAWARIGTVVQVEP